jgi:hypothetical protein
VTAFLQVLDEQEQQALHHLTPSLKVASEKVVIENSTDQEPVKV